MQQGRQAVGRGDHGVAVDTFRSARGPGPRARRSATSPTAGSPATPWPGSTSWSLAAHEGLVDGELTMGRHADVLADLVDLVARYPLRERFRAQLIIALYRSGRQADALQAYRDARQYLLDELGLDPGPSCRASNGRCWPTIPALAAPIALTPITSARPAVPAPLTSFVGRRRRAGDARRRRRRPPG